MRFFFATLIVAQVLAVSAMASSQVDVSSTLEGHYFTDAQGQLLADGNLVLMGNFSEPLAIAEALPFEEMAALAGWQEFGSMAVSTIGGVIPGKILGEVVNNDAAASAAFASEQIFLWVFNTPSISTATQYGIFTAIDPEVNWRFPSTDNILRYTMININDAMAVIGGADGDRMYLTGIIPEPGTYAAILSLLAVGAALRMKRRNGIK